MDAVLIRWDTYLCLFCFFAVNNLLVELIVAKILQDIDTLWGQTGSLFPASLMEWHQNCSPILTETTSVAQEVYKNADKQKISHLGLYG